MPRPPMLEPTDWQTVFDSGVDYDAWIAAAESDDRRQTMQDALAAQPLDAMTVGLLDEIPRNVYVVAIAEDWCGDVVRHVPVLQKLCESGPNLHVRYVTREQHPEVFKRFLTNGGEAIPKFVFLSSDWVECGNWGPMAENGKRLIARGKAAGDVGTARKKVGLLYESDPEKNDVIRELVALIETASCSAP